MGEEDEHGHATPYIRLRACVCMHSIQQHPFYRNQITLYSDPDLVPFRAFPANTDRPHCMYLLITPLREPPRFDENGRQLNFPIAAESTPRLRFVVWREARFEACHTNEIELRLGSCHIVERLCRVCGGFVEG